MIHFPILKETIFFRPVGVFNSSGVLGLLYVTVYRYLTFVKKAIIYENGMTQYVFLFSIRITCEEWK